MFKKLRKNKRGDIGDIGIFIGLIFALGITIYFGALVWGNVVSPLNEKINEIVEDPIVEAKINTSMQQVNDTFSVFDWVFAIFFFGFYLVLLISVFYLDTSPAFFIFALLGMLVLFIIGAVISDSWINVKGETDSMISSSGKVNMFEFPIMNNILSNLLIYLIVMSSIFLIVLYASKRVGG